jgi:hypothetical protein
MTKIENNTNINNNNAGSNSNAVVASAAATPTALASSDFSKIRILNSAINNQQSKNSN